MVNETVQRQATQAIGTLIASIRNCPDELLSTQLPEQERTLADLIAHALRPIVMNLGRPDDPRLLACGWPLQGTVTRDDLVNTAIHILNVTIAEYLEQHALTEADDQPEYFLSRLDRVMKVLRHLAHHTGEVNWILRVNGVERGKFICK